jgi:tetratricopeptide (TPR) repeat protein
VLSWALDSGEAEIAQRLVFALSRFWYVRGYLSEGLSWAERALANGVTTSTRARAEALAATAYLSWARGDQERASALWPETIILFRQFADPIGLGLVLHSAGLVAEEGGEHDRARSLQEEALALCQQANEQIFAAHVLNALGQLVYREHGDLDRAKDDFARALQQFQAFGDAYGAGLALANLGRVARDQGNYKQAADLYAEALMLHWDDGDSGRIAACLNGLGVVAALAGEAEQAARLCGAAAALREAIGAPIPSYRGQYDRAIETARTSLGEAAFRAA